MATEAVTQEFKDGWMWKEYVPDDDLFDQEMLGVAENEWTEVLSFPSEIHVELLKAGRIPDPFLGFNEHEVQCECPPD